MTSKPNWHVDPPKEVKKEVEFKNEAEVVLDKEEVEDEVLEAKDEVPALVVQESVVKKDQIPPIKELKKINDLAPSKEEIAYRDKLRAESKPAKPKRTENETRVLVKNLRKQDDDHNRTCARCVKRLPLDKFPRLKKSEVCEDCE